MEYTSYQEIREVLVSNDEENTRACANQLKESLSVDDLYDSELRNEAMDKLLNNDIMFKVSSENDLFLIQNHLKGLNPADLVNELVLLMDTIELDDQGVKIFQPYGEILKVYVENMP